MRRLAEIKSSGKSAVVKFKKPPKQGASGRK
jgi:hypothetical protein